MTVLPHDGPTLAAEFPDSTREQWHLLVEGVLRRSGKEFSGFAAEDALTTDIEDGVRARPLYTADDTAVDSGYPGFAPFVRGGRAEGSVLGGWDVRQRHAHPDP
ncbi:methylmalonyl-CoA mutase family protein, partial [Kitasatospora sp. NPDC057223]|uniref:methylmalonyl-CoA mutase family protein n=1 Tax=Kitasatospora sp. NPDC057223 TaxID=3346055 RepID=UPI00362E7321